MSADEREDELFLHAAGALEDAERDEVEAWLAAGGREAAARYEAAEADLAALAAALPPAAPEPAVKARLIRRISVSIPTRAGTASGATAGAARPRLGAGPVLVGLAAGVVITLLAAIAGNQAVQRRGVARELAEVRARVETLEQERDALDAELGDQERALRELESEQVLARKTIDLLAAEGMESLALAGAGSQAGARGRVFWDWEDWYCFARIQGLAAGSERLYALWLLTDDGEAVSVGTFRAGEGGAATLLAPVRRDIGHVVRAAVSVEPDEALGPAPRGEIVLTGPAGA